MLQNNGPQGKRVKKKGRTLWLIAGSVLLCAAVVLLIVFSGKEQADTPSGGESDTGETLPADIHMPVGALLMPEEWKSDIQIVENTDKTPYTLRAYGSVGDEQILLFELFVGEQGEGYHLGSAPDTDGVLQDIWLNIQSLQPKDSWTEEDTARLNTLQSCVNDLVSQLYALKGFQMAD